MFFLFMSLRHKRSINPHILGRPRLPPDAVLPIPFRSLHFLMRPDECHSGRMYPDAGAVDRAQSDLSYLISRIVFPTRVDVLSK
jgi:hypothetical protein